MKMMSAYWDTLLTVAVLFLVPVLISPLPAAAEESFQVKSIEQLESEYKARPRDHVVNYEYCGKLIEGKDYSQAVEVCTLTIETGTENTLSWSFLNRGIAYKELGKLDDATSDREESKQHGMPNWLLDSYLKL